MSKDCSAIPTTTLYGAVTSSVVTTRTFLATSTLAGGIVETSTSFEFDTALTTKYTPTATQYLTQCKTTANPQTQQSSNFTTSTDGGGQVIIQTFIQTFTSKGSVVVETQTASANPANATSFATHNDDSRKSDTGAIAGGIVGGVAFLALLLGLFWLLRKRKKNALASRNLDEFFADPSTMDWDEKNNSNSNNGTGRFNGAGRASRAGSLLGIANGTTSRGGTLRSLKRGSLGVLDLEKDKGVSETDQNHWAALTRIDSAQLDEEREMQEALSNHGRPQSRQSLNGIGRPLSYHSLSHAHGLISPQAFILPNEITPELEPLDANPALLRNDSDKSSKSGNSPSALSNIQTRSMDMLPSFLSGVSPPISPTSPYGSPPLRDLPLREGVPLSSNGYPQTDQRPTMGRGPRSSSNSNILMPDATMTGVPNTVKPRSWSSGTFNVPERPKSALGLSGQASPPLSAIFANQVIHQSPPISPTLMPVHTGSPDQHRNSGLQRGRASLNGGTPQYPNIYTRGSMKGFSHQQQQNSTQPPQSPNAYFSTSPTHQQPYPPSQYSHLDVYKTEEERAEDRMHAAMNSNNGISNLNGLERDNNPDRQRRHRSLSGALTLHVTNGEVSPKLNFSTPNSDAMTPNSSTGEKSALSVRNADFKNSTKVANLDEE